MSMHAFVRTSLFKDLLAALDAEWYLHFSNYLGPRAPTRHNDRYSKDGYPIPRRKPNCWCSQRSVHRCPTQQGEVGRDQCRSIPRLEVGEGFRIDRCDEYHGSRQDRKCPNPNCFQWSDVIAPWVRQVLYAQEEHNRSTKVSQAVQEEVARLIREYGYKVDRQIWGYVKIICIVIQNFHDPSSSMGIRWMPEIHGVIWLHEVSRSEVVRGILIRIRHAKEAREGAAVA